MGSTDAIGVPRPPGCLRRLSNALVHGLKDPDTSEKLALVGAEVMTSTPDEFRSYLANEIKLMGNIVKSAGIQPL